MRKHIKGESVKFKVSNVVYALIAAVAASAAFTVHAAERTTRNWTGGTGTADAPKDLWDYENWDGEGNFGQGNTVNCFLSVTDKTYLNSANSSRFCCDLVPNAGDFVFTGPLQFYSFKPGSVENSTVSVLKKSGDWTVATYGMYIGNASGTKAKFVNESGDINVTSTSYGVHLGCIAGATGIVENVSGNWTIEGSLTVGDASGGTGAFTIKGGSVSSGSALNIANNGATGTLTVAGGSLSVGGSLYIIREDTNNSGTLTIKEGTVTVSPTGYTIFSKGYGSINLDGGTFVTKRIDRWGSNSTRVQYVNFNGGTLKANEAESLIYARYGYMHVTVGAGGGTIDCNGYPVTIDLAAENDANNDIEGVGGLTFTGGNTNTIKSKVSYSGATRVTPGTTLAITHADAKDNILSHGLVVTDIPTAGQTVFTYISALDDDDLAKVSCPCAPETTFKFSDEGKTNIVVDVVGSPDWTKYSHKFKVAFSGYVGSETLANFPVLVNISESGIFGFHYADCKKPGGADLRFADASGNLLASEVDTWDTNGVSLVWVKVPSLTAATKITAYYGWDSAPVVDSSAVWTDNGYVGVWHLNEAALPLAESSGISSPFTEGEKPQFVDFGASGIIGKSVDFGNYTNNAYGSSRLHADDDDGHLSGLTDFTVECWTYQTKYWTEGTSAAIVSKGEGNYRSWKVYQDHTTLKTGLELTEVSGASTNRTWTTSGQGVKTGEWVYQTIVRNKTGLNKCLVYFNGENEKSVNDNRSSIESNTRPLILGGGGYGGTARVFPGSIDEVRISNVARSADWVKASHDTVTESSFAKYGSAGENVDKGLMIFVR